MNVTCSCHNIAVKLPTTITSQTNNSHCLTEPQGIPQQPSTGQIVRLITFFACYFVFKNENVNVILLTLALIAVAKICRNSFVFSGSCPATILFGFTDRGYYLTFCTFSFQFKESSLSDTRCCITTLCLW
jgi:hypothetical protein